MGLSSMPEFPMNKPATTIFFIAGGQKDIFANVAEIKTSGRAQKALLFAFGVSINIR